MYVSTGYKDIVDTNNVFQEKELIIDIGTYFSAQKYVGRLPTTF